MALEGIFNPRKDPVPIVQEAGWAPGPVWTSAENLAPTGIQSPDRPARSQSLSRVRYPAHKTKCNSIEKDLFLTDVTCSNDLRNFLYGS